MHGRSVRLWSAVAWRLALTALLAVTAVRVWDLHSTLQRFQDAGHAEAQATRTAALTAIADTRKDLLAEVRAIRTGILAHADSALLLTDTKLDALTGLADIRLKDATGKLDAQLTRTNDTLAGVRSDLKPTLDNSAALTAQVNEAAKPLLPLVDESAKTLLDCHAKGTGPSCLPSQTLALVGSARSTLGQIAKSAPEATQAFVAMEKDAAGVTKDVHKAADAYVAPSPWYKKLGNAFYSAAILAAHFL